MFIYRHLKITLDNGKNMLNGNSLKYFYEQLTMKFRNVAFWKSTHLTFLTSTLPPFTHAVFNSRNPLTALGPPVHGPHYPKFTLD